jgi:N-acetylglucosaminyldiphosphoundecaprenol N-acetyl-beta-D-mannosaminyltransferase
MKQLDKYKLYSTSFNSILGTKIHFTSYNDATKLIMDWSKNNIGRVICVANVHMVMEAYDNLDFQEVINRADMVTPDGMPLVWVLRRMGCDIKDRVYGPTLTLWVLEAAAKQGIPVGFYGAAPDVLDALIANIRKKFPTLNIAYTHSPPFRELSFEEDECIIRKINKSGTRILFVGLGCPKQELWMAKHQGKVQAVMLGVGAAFDFHAGKLRQAPPWMQARGLEWLFRFFVEPRRLWKRYFKHNPRFAFYSMLQLLRLKRKKNL